MGALFYTLKAGKFYHAPPGLVNINGDTIPAMLRSKWKIILAIFILGVLLVPLVYQVPWVKQRLEWRLDIARTYVRGVFNPGSAVPTPITRATLEVMAASPTPTIEPRTSTPAPELQAGTATPGATQTPAPSATPTPTASPIPERVELTPMTWEKQDWNNCGPAALSIYLNYYGWEGDQFTISSVVKPVREDRNVNVEELVYFARNYAGWLQTIYRVGGDIDMLRAFIAAGIPVMIESSFFFDGAYWPNDDLWAAHYLVVNGYDQAKDTFTLQDTFHGADQVLSAGTLDAYWQPFNRVFILAYLPDQETTVRDILGPSWDEVTNRQLALETAQAEVQADEKDAYAWFNLGSNLVYFERYAEAAAAYDQARTIGWPQRMLRYQFGPFFAYFHSDRFDDLYALSDYALKYTYNSEEAFLWRGWARYRLGDFNGAVSDFQAALDANYLYQDAQYALDFVTGQ
jgi:tetratricopeptide (TPR) repeat protein